MTFQRASGILLHPTSLPSTHGIGDLGQSAYAFIDFLECSGQKIWQVLPLGPTGYEHSPYIMNFSSFAGNPLLISLDRLVEQGWLTADDVLPLDSFAERVEFDRVVPHKMGLLQRAYGQFQQALAADSDAHSDFEAFCQEQSWWLTDYVLFMALLEAHDYRPWNQWDGSNPTKPLARRDPAALQAQSEQLQDRLQFHRFLQFTFFQQWRALRTYANEKGILVVGDVSIYVCHNSADVWANPTLFKLDPETLDPAFMAGVPPDYFSATGQLWGNPVYDWDALHKTQFAWWIARFKATLQYVDIVRIDHFRGFEAYWQVPAGETTAMNGEWIKAPGIEFFETLNATLGHLPVMAEDLGIITPEVEELRDRFQFPGMRILQFAFTGDVTNPYLPHNYVTNCVVYPGTHDNDTALGWWQQASATERQQVADYLGYTNPDAVQEIHWDLIRLALASVADLAIIPLQDLLGLDSTGRMNDPSINAGQWRWRMSSSDCLNGLPNAPLNEAGEAASGAAPNSSLAARLFHLTRLYRR